MSMVILCFEARLAGYEEKGGICFIEIDEMDSVVDMLGVLCLPLDLGPEFP